ncbi:MAG: asparagine synthase (glutamine-hydrolyzing) [Nitrososphaerota archaeon]
MCGIFGILSIDQNKVNINVLERMSHSLIHRGPDDYGYVFFELFNKQRILETNNIFDVKQIENYQGVLAFGHRRLSIIDLSKTGHQPMSNENRDIWIILNGEIYNYIELSEELKKRGHKFYSKTDTEVIIHAYEEWGADCLNHFNGMWAFALWDKRKKRIFCSRDRFGIKPFYYYYDGKTFVFASEIKAILQDPAIRRIPNDKRIYDYLGYGYLDHTEETFFKNINQLRGSNYLTLDIKGTDLNLKINQYWDIKPIELRGVESFEKRFLELFKDSINLHLRSDVPIGTCLSGGLDSSSIVCVTQEYLNSNIHKTFSSCFEDQRYDEREYIQKVIETNHIEPHFVFPNPKKLFEEINELIWYQEEPFGSTSIYAQWNVFKLAKEKGIKVVLDGQGADELLAGYHPFLGFYLSELINEFHFYDFIKEYKLIRSIYKYSHFWFIGHLLISLLPLPLSAFIKKQILFKKNNWLKRNNNFIYKTEFKNKFKNILHNQLYNYLMIFSLPALLHYEDRNSMAHSIEARVPFLDYRLVELIFSLPIKEIINNGFTKYILRKAMQGILPESIRMRRDKMGFVTPEDIWFKTVLKNFVNDIINSKSFSERIYFDVKKVKAAYKNHCEQKINISATIWRWINLEIWLKTFIDNMPQIR